MPNLQCISINLTFCNNIQAFRFIDNNITNRICLQSAPLRKSIAPSLFPNAFSLNSPEVYNNQSHQKIIQQSRFSISFPIHPHGFIVNPWINLHQQPKPRSSQRKDTFHSLPKRITVRWLVAVPARIVLNNDIHLFSTNPSSRWKSTLVPNSLGLTQKGHQFDKENDDDDNNEHHNNDKFITDE